MITGLRKAGLPLLSLLIAIGLWLHVHGRGEGTVSLDVPLQIHGLPAGLVVINDLPDHVRVTFSGLQARLGALSAQDLHVPVDASNLKEPGVAELAIKAGDITVPPGLSVDKIQPDRLELQVDRIIQRAIPVHARFDLPPGWRVDALQLEPAKVELNGPEIWLDSLVSVNSEVLRMDTPAAGPFERDAGIESPTGKAIHLANDRIKVKIRGMLVYDAPVQPHSGGK
jgi:YbbR-like protein